MSEAVKSACYFYNYKWPKELWSGVMFFDGARITIQQFNTYAGMFK
jgi:hypothetical protein